MQLAVIADTHVPAGSSKDLPREVWDRIESADLVLHAGDVTSPGLLDRIASVTPVVAVLGNNDVDLDHLPERWTDTVRGVHVAMVHDSGPTKGRAARLHRWFPDADLVVFGHSHAPVREVGIDGQWILNPGSPTQRRRQPVHTMAQVTIRDGSMEIEVIPVRAASGRRRSGS